VLSDREGFGLSRVAHQALCVDGEVACVAGEPGIEMFQRGVQLAVDLQSVVLAEVRGRASREVSLARRTVAETVVIADDQADCGESREKGRHATSRDTRFPGERVDGFRFEEAAEQVELKRREQRFGSNEPVSDP
jgi:hypothetical protein